MSTKAIITQSYLTDIANAIIAKDSGSAMLPSQMATRITNLPSGGGTISPLSVTANGTYTASAGDGYSPVTVAVKELASVLAGGNISYIDLTGVTTIIAYNIFANLPDGVTVYAPDLTDILSTVQYDANGRSGTGYGISSLIAPNLINVVTSGFRIRLARGFVGKLSLPSLTWVGNEWIYQCRRLTELDTPSMTALGAYFCEDNTSLRKITVGLLTSVHANAFRGINTGTNTVDLYCSNTTDSLRALGTLPFNGTNYMVFHCSGNNKKIVYVDGAWTDVDE